MLHNTNDVIEWKRKSWTMIKFNVIGSFVIWDLDMGIRYCLKRFRSNQQQKASHPEEKW